MRALEKRLKYVKKLTTGETRKIGRGLTCVLAFATVLSSTGLARAEITEELINLLVLKGIVTQGEADKLRTAHRAEQAERTEQIRDEVARSFDAQKVEQKKVIKKQVEKTVAKVQPAKIETEKFLTSLDSGVGFKAGDVKFQVSGNVNAFSTYEDISDDLPIAGGLVATGGDNEFAVRNGLLPNALTFDISTVQEGIDVRAKIGLFPGTNNLNSATAVNANGGGSNISLGTPGIDARQGFLEFGTAEAGKLKLGRDIGLFGQSAIFNDFGIFGVGAPLGSAAPANTSLGRIGLGYIYADFVPQITYTSPDLGGLTAALSFQQPYDAVAFSGIGVGASGDDLPQVQGQLTYGADFGGVDTTLWSGFTTTAYEVGDDTERGYGLEAGGKFNLGNFGLLAYGYYGDGLGTTAIGFDALGPNGETRESFGGYIQGTYAITDRTTLGASYGVSFLDEASGESSPNLIESNSSANIGLRYKLTPWITLQGEYTYTEAEAQDGRSISNNAFTAGSILFF